MAYIELFHTGHFTKFLVGGLAFGENFRSPLGMESGGGGFVPGTESDEGGLGEIVR